MKRYYASYPREALTDGHIGEHLAGALRGSAVNLSLYNIVKKVFLIAMSAEAL